MAETVYHLACECPHVDMQRSRAALAASLPALVLGVWFGGLEALEAERRPDPVLTEAQHTALQNLCARPPDFGSPQTRFVAYWMLMGTPWPAFVTDADPQQHAGAAALGALFDALCVRPQRLRQWAFGWLSWSEWQLVALAQARHRALGTTFCHGQAGTQRIPPPARRR